MTLGKDIQSDWVALYRISCLKFRKCQASIKTIHLRLENIFLGVADSHYSCSVVIKINSFQTDYPVWGEGFILGWIWDVLDIFRVIGILVVVSAFLSCQLWAVLNSKNVFMAGGVQGWGFWVANLTSSGSRLSLIKS